MIGPMIRYIYLQKVWVSLKYTSAILQLDNKFPAKRAISREERILPVYAAAAVGQDRYSKFALKHSRIEKRVRQGGMLGVPVDAKLARDLDAECLLLGLSRRLGSRRCLGLNRAYGSHRRRRTCVEQSNARGPLALLQPIPRAFSDKECDFPHA